MKWISKLPFSLLCLSIFSSCNNGSEASLDALSTREQTTEFASHNLAEERGNGGKAMVCTPFNRFRSAELLDLFEGRKIPEWNLLPAMGDAAEYMDRVKLVIERIKKFDPLRAQRYEAARASFLENAKFLTNSSLPDLPDVGITSIPSGCKLMQLAIQRTPELPGQKLYTIDGDIWNLDDNGYTFTADNKAALILHEIVYGEAKHLGHLDSTKVRYFVANIVSNLMLKNDQTWFNQLLKTVNLLPAGTEIDGVAFALDGLERYPSGVLKKAWPLHSSAVYSKRQGAFLVSGAVSSLSAMEFYENSFVKRLGFVGSVSVTQFLRTETCDSSYSRVAFAESGVPTSATPSHFLNIGYFFNGNCLRATGLGENVSAPIEFYSNGVPKSILGASAQVALYDRIETIESPSLYETGMAKSGFISSRKTFMCDDGVTREFLPSILGRIYLNFDRQGRVKVDAEGNPLDVN